MEFKPRRGISIFWELLPQVEVHRGTSPPPNGGVPRLVSFNNVYFNQLLEDDDFRPTMHDPIPGDSPELATPKIPRGNLEGGALQRYGGH